MPNTTTKAANTPNTAALSARSTRGGKAQELRRGVLYPVLTVSAAVALMQQCISVTADVGYVPMQAISRHVGHQT